MKKNQTDANMSLIVLTAIAVVVLLLSLVNLNQCRKELAQLKMNQNENITYEVEGVPTTMTNGVSKVAISETPLETITTYYGQASGDFDGNGLTDTARILVQTNGGSGTGFYLVADLDTPKGIIGTPAVFLGDRIVVDAIYPTTDDQIGITYRIHGENQAMAEMPTESVDQVYTIVNGALQLVEPAE